MFMYPFGGKKKKKPIKSTWTVFGRSFCHVQRGPDFWSRLEQLADQGFLLVQEATIKSWNDSTVGIKLKQTQQYSVLLFSFILMSEIAAQLSCQTADAAANIGSVLHLERNAFGTHFVTSSIKRTK